MIRRAWARITGADSNTLEVTPPRVDFTSDAARRYHESNQYGRN